MDTRSEVKDIFTAENGREIRLIENWFQRKPQWPYGITDFRQFVDEIIVGASYPNTPSFGLNKLITANAFKALLIEHGFSFSRDLFMLDVCTGPAILPRVFKALKLVGQVVGIDIQDRSDHYSAEDITHFWMAAGNQAVADDGTLFDTYSLVNNVQIGDTNVFDFLLIEDPVDASLLTMDDYVVADFIEHEFAEVFDLVTLASGFEYMDVEAFFAKLAMVMKPGAYFATFNTYFYDISGSAMHLPMDAPWLHARVSWADFMRCYAENHPDLKDCAEKAYYFSAGHRHKTVKDYKAAAARHGLEMLSFRRVLPEEQVKDWLFGDASKRTYFVYEVLADARALNPTVTPEDLLTIRLTMVFCRS